MPFYSKEQDVLFKLKKILNFTRTISIRELKYSPEGLHRILLTYQTGLLPEFSSRISAKMAVSF